MEGMLLDNRNPVKILPNIRHLIGFINEGVFSLMLLRVMNQGCPSSAKKMARRVIKRAQVFVYDC